MPTYTSDANLLNELPASLPAALTPAIRAIYIADASAEVDARVGMSFALVYGGNTQKFPGITDSPATPSVIEQCCHWLAAYRCYVKLKEINRDPRVNSQGLTLRKMAVDDLAAIRDGEMEVILSDGTRLGPAGTLELESTTRTRDAAFTRGRYVDGVLEGDAGTLDNFVKQGAPD